MDASGEFLADLVARPLSAGQAAGLRPVALYLGKGQNAIEVVTFGAAARPAAGALQSAWRERRGGRASPVLLVAL